MFETIVTLSIMAGYLFILAIGGFIADYILPHFHFLDDFYNTLPMSDPETYNRDPFEPLDADYTPID